MKKKIKKFKALKLLFKLAKNPDEKADSLLKVYQQLEEEISEAIHTIQKVHENSVISVSDIKGNVREVVKMINDSKKYHEGLLETHKKLIDKNYLEHKGDTKEESKKIKEVIKKQLDYLTGEVERLGDNKTKSWGGSSRTLYLNGNTMSPQNLYSDINFIPGTGVTMTAVNNTQTLQTDVTISSGGAGAVWNEEYPVSGVVNGSNKVFVFTHTPEFISLEGQALSILNGDYTVSVKTVTLTNAPLSVASGGTGNPPINKYLS